MLLLCYTVLCAETDGFDRSVKHAALAALELLPESAEHWQAAAIGSARFAFKFMTLVFKLMNFRF